MSSKDREAFAVRESLNILQSIKKGMGNLGYEFKEVKKVDGLPHEFIVFDYKGHDVQMTILNASSASPQFQLRNWKRPWVQSDTLDGALEEALILTGVFEPID